LPLTLILSPLAGREVRRTQADEGYRANIQNKETLSKETHP
jgi:hypothetical protein